MLLMLCLATLNLIIVSPQKYRHHLCGVCSLPLFVHVSSIRVYFLLLQCVGPSSPPNIKKNYLKTFGVHLKNAAKLHSQSTINRNWGQVEKVICWVCLSSTHLWWGLVTPIPTLPSPPALEEDPVCRLFYFGRNQGFGVMFLQGLWEKWWARISSSVTLSLWSFCL